MMGGTTEKRWSWWRFLLAAVVGIAAGAAWVAAWRWSGAAYAAEDLATSTIGIASALAVLAFHVTAPTFSGGAIGAGRPASKPLLRRLLESLTPLDLDAVGPFRIGRGVMCVRLSVLAFASLLSGLLLIIGIAQWRIDYVLLGACPLPIFLFMAACDIYTLSRRRRSVAR